MGTNVGIFFVLFLSVALALEEVPNPTEAKLRVRFPGNLFKKKSQEPLPIETIFKLPAPIPVWPPGNGYSSGIIDLGGLQVSQITTFNKIWAAYEGGADNKGVTVFEPTGIPQGFSMLGSYSQGNNKALFGWVLVAKDVSNGSLAQPTGYSLVWSTESLNIQQDSHAYVWLPVPPKGYAAVGHVVTASPGQPSLDRVRVVRLDLTEQCEKNRAIWNAPDGFNFYEARPSSRGTEALGVQVGTFISQKSDLTASVSSISCLKNTKSITSPMPNIQQIGATLKAYSPLLYLHPKEEYLPSSVDWFFANGGLLYTRGNESNPVPITQKGSNLPQDPNNDGAYWLDLPIDAANKQRVKRGDLPSSRAYVHVKPMLGGTFSDIAMWVYYPFNGPARAKVEFFTVNLGKIGEHVGDWEHVTLRISNFNGQLWQVYFAQHSHGQWVEASQLEYRSGNKPIVYSSLHGHASYPHPGLVLNGAQNGVGIRNDTASSDTFLDMASYELVSADYLGSAVVGPPWLNFFREWGPKIDYNIDEELKNVEKVLPAKLRKLLENIVRGLPAEVLGEQGPTGPKVKGSWSGDEV